MDETNLLFAEALNDMLAATRSKINSSRLGHERRSWGSTRLGEDTPRERSESKIMSVRSRARPSVGLSVQVVAQEERQPAAA